jgi:hypothetical protein
MQSVWNDYREAHGLAPIGFDLGETVLAAGVAGGATLAGAAAAEYAAGVLGLTGAGQAMGRWCGRCWGTRRVARSVG